MKDLLVTVQPYKYKNTNKQRTYRCLTGVSLMDEYKDWVKRKELEKHFPANFLWFINTVKIGHENTLCNGEDKKVLEWIVRNMKEDL